MPFSDQERQATITQYLREIEDNTMRSRALWGIMQQKGRITYNCGGRNFEWRIRMNELAPRVYDGSSSPIYAAVNRYQTASLNYKMLHLGEKLDKQVLDLNKGQEAIVNLMQDALNSANGEFMRGTSVYLFNDGNATGATGKWDGFETFCGRHGSNTGSSGKTRDPSDTFAGLSTAPGTYGGSWTGDWPDGRTDEGPAYDFWSPVLVDTSASAWGTSPTATFANYGDQQLTFAISRNTKFRPSIYGGDGSNKAMGDETGIVLMTAEMRESFRNLFSGTQRTLMDQTPKEMSFGFKVMNYDGWLLVDDFDVPADTFYGFRWSAIEYRSVYSRMIEALKNQAGKEVGFSHLPDGSGVLVGGWMHGNLKCNPRGFFKGYPYT